MLPITSFSSGALGDCEPNSVLVFRDEPIIVLGQPAYAIATDSWKIFPTEGVVAWKGLSVGDLRIEVDPGSRYEESKADYSHGNIIIRGNQVYIAAIEDDGFRRPALYEVDGSAFQDLRKNLGSGFTRWQLVVGTGADKTVVGVVDGSEFTLKI